MKLGKTHNFVIGAVAALVFLAFEESERAPAPPPAASATPVAGAGGMREYRQIKVVMYSLTTCSYCRVMRRELEARNIPYVERFLDTEQGAKAELEEKLQRAGLRPGYIGTPTLEVNGVMLLNNPSMRTVLKHL